jgi:3'-phosphoadenosine 5'-phosphosulfate sulfotransferase (PAPS reductase)/FAD synthetase
LSIVRPIVSISGGKDSLACAILALDQFPDTVRFVMADTGNEHPLTLAYVNDYLTQRLNHPIEIVRAEFTREIAQKRLYVETKWPGKGVPDDIVARTLAVLQPTGNPFLDLCLWKGRFPSRMAQFCTQHLKRYPLDRYLMERVSEGGEVESWRGVRKAESERRKNALARERMAEGYWIVQPIVEWTAQEVVDFARTRGFKHNPLYMMGMGRVGCMPCINSSKDEILAVSWRAPEHIDKIEEWESLVGAASKRGFASFFTERAEDDDETPSETFDRANIREKIRWAQTSRGGKQFDMIRTSPPPACASVYGLCE